METLECINTRRSIRKYKDKEVKEELVKKILGAAMNAPSAGNEQPWHFIVINEREILQKISAIHPGSSMAKDASVGILICADMAFDKAKGMWPLDCAAATQNILLAAHDLGLGGVWTACYLRPDRSDAMKAIFNLPDSIIPFSFIPIGYPDQEYNGEDRFKEERIHYNSW